MSDGDFQTKQFCQRYQTVKKLKFQSSSSTYLVQDLKNNGEQFVID